MNITLIGMAGAGKSYLGKQVAEKLGFDFYDNDTGLLEVLGKPIQEALDELGDTALLDLEARILIEGTRGRDRVVISPGGSVIYRDSAMHHLRNISKIVYLKVPLETVENRLRDLAPRGIIGLGRKTLRELYDERHPLYEKNADLILETEKMSSDDVILAIVELIRR